MRSLGTARIELAADCGQTVPQSIPLEKAPLAVQGLTVSYGEKPAVFSVDAIFEPATLTAIIGPNGAGKSTMLKALLGVVPRLSGDVFVFGQPLESMRDKVAYVPQRASVDWDFPASVIDIVLMGRYREMGLLGRLTGRHVAKAMACLEQVGMADFAERQIGQLSGGQQQRVFLARALAQDAELYLLDEPFAGVDAATEKAIVDVLKSFKDRARAVIAVHHDLATVHAYFDHVFLLNVRKIVHGSVADAFNAGSLHATYGGRLATTQLDQLDLAKASA